MILTFSCKLTQAIYEGKRVPRFVQIESVATRKLQQLDSAVTIDFFVLHQVIALRHCAEIAKVNIVSASMINIAFVLFGQIKV